MTTEIIPAAQTLPAAVTPMDMIDKALASGASPEALEKLLALQERWEANQAKRAFDTATQKSFSLKEWSGMMLERCGNCRCFTLAFPDDETATNEGKCSVKNWTGPLFVYGDDGKMAGVTWGYHPSVLRGDGCRQFSPAERMEKADG